MGELMIMVVYMNSSDISPKNVSGPGYHQLWSSVAAI